MPRRRALLASLGAAAVAGCVGSTPPRTSTGTPRPPDTPDPLSSIDTDWPVPGFDAGNSNRTGAAGPVERIADLWSVTADARLSHAVLADETLYVGSRAGTVLAVDACTGETRWQRSVGDSASTPRVVSGLVCVPTNAGIVALEPTDGSERWRVETPNRANGSLVAASITPLDSAKGDKLEVWDGNDWDDWVSDPNATEGRDGEYWFDAGLGQLFVYDRFVWRSGPQIRLSYRYGSEVTDTDEDGVPDDIPRNIRQACKKLVAMDLIASDQFSQLIPGGDGGMSPEGAIDKWERDVFGDGSRRKGLLEREKHDPAWVEPY